MTEVPAEYLINYGRTAFLGRFVNCAADVFARGERVVVQTARGLEAGTILQDVSPKFAHLVGLPNGDLLRPMTEADAAKEDQCLRNAGDLHQQAQIGAEAVGLPLTILDVEILLDGRHAFLHTLPFAECDPGPFIQHLQQHSQLTISLLDARHAAVAEPEGCGKPGCGSKNGSCGDCGSGCSTGGCSSGKVKNASEMTAYFQQLRQKMESEFGRLPLHG